MQWAGFERVPRGRLLSQLVDLAGPLGLAYERSVGFSKDEHIHDRHMLVCPRGAAVMDILQGRKRHRVDARHVLWVPKRSPHADAAVTTLYDTLALYPSDALVKRAATEAGLSDTSFVERYVLAPRTPFLSELLEQYFTTRLVDGAPGEAFQERQLVSAALRALTGSRPEPSLRVADATDDVGLRSLRYIEANLFLPIALSDIARHAGASTSTLLRAFRRTTGQTPYAYIKTRRLDEAGHLLRGGRHAVGEVALLVGYEDFGAFSKAFHRRFRQPPSAVIAARKTR
jgi:AraC-like DNA-binding protein